VPLLETIGSSSALGYGFTGSKISAASLGLAYTSGLILYLDGKVYDSGSTSWKDISGQENNFTLNGSLSYSSSTGSFSGFSNQNYWKNSNSVFRNLKQAQGGNGFTAFVVSQAGTPDSVSTGWQSMLSSGDGNNYIDSWASAAAPHTFTCEDGAATSNYIYQNNNLIANNTVDMRTKSVWTWGVLNEGGTTFTNPVNPDLLIGSDPTNIAAGSPNPYFWRGTINAVLIYNTVLSSTNRATVVSFLRSRYGI
jgi:hypothetical protein